MLQDIDTTESIAPRAYKCTDNKEVDMEVWAILVFKQGIGGMHSVKVTIRDDLQAAYIRAKEAIAGLRDVSEVPRLTDHSRAVFGDPVVNYEQHSIKITLGQSVSLEDAGVIWLTLTTAIQDVQIIL